jgi:hypothetical protein
MGLGLTYVRFKKTCQEKISIKAMPSHVNSIRKKRDVFSSYGWTVVFNLIDIFKILFRDVAAVILESSQWKEALRNDYIDLEGVLQTPMRLLIKDFPDLVRSFFN